MPKKEYILWLIISILFFSCNEPKRDIRPKQLKGGFKLLPSEVTSIDFSNTITETRKQNFMYNSQIYNGSGVAIGDINNDGLPDVFFGGNQVSDRLYLNKGNFKFEDITKTSQVAKNQGWTWGVTMIDINNDGYLDIYVSRNGDSMNPKDRRNQLYINNKDLTFTESADSYGLADLGFSSQAVFFDMDNDGDLDMYQVNQPPDPRLFRRTKLTAGSAKYYTDKLYKNENGTYIDASKEVRILDGLTHGLNVVASDFNNDGWADLYISNDYDEPDQMYYNNRNGTFRNVTDLQLKHMSRFSMGADAGDVNNDGLVDLMTLDMSAEDHYRSKTNMGSMSTTYFNELVAKGKHYQYMYNTLQINTGRNSFSDIAQMTGVASTDWSWSALIVDLDNDGLKDIAITNGIKKDMRNNDYVALLNQKVNDGSEDFYTISKNAPSFPLSNYIFKNKGGLKFEKAAANWAFNTKGFSTGMAYGDLDNDGDLDLVINNIDAPAFVYENQATGNFLKIKTEGTVHNKFGIGAKAVVYYGDKKQLVENYTTRGYLSSVEPIMFLGLGKDVEIDKVDVIWPDGKINTFTNVKANTLLKAKYSRANVKEKEVAKTNTYLKQVSNSRLGIDHVFQENEFNDFETEILLPHKLSENGPFSAVADVNGDNLEDVFIGAAAGHSAVLYLQTMDGTFKKSESQPWQKDKQSEDLGCIFLDIDGDNDQDLYVASGGSEFKRGDKLLKDRLYLNQGDGSFLKRDNAVPNIFESSQSVTSADIDNDGDLDLFVGVRLIADKYPHPATSYFLINEGGMLKRAPRVIAPDLQNIGMVTDAVFSDIDKDFDQDLILVGEWMNILVLENKNGSFTNTSDSWGLANTRGLWWSITVTDLDSDGDDDYIVGNLGKNNKFKATKEHPFKIYANDFDSNGTNDIVLAKFYRDAYVPVRGRECSSQQMPYIAEKFKDYHSFASSSLIEILPEEKFKNAVTYEIDNFESIILRNENGKLVKTALPVEAQFFPIKSSLVYDFNKDGHKDILLVGNHYGVEVETVRYDAGIGALLLGDGTINVKASSAVESGFYVPYDSRDVVLIKSPGKERILVVNNKAKPSVFDIVN